MQTKKKEPQKKYFKVAKLTRTMKCVNYIKIYVPMGGSKF